MMRFILFLMLLALVGCGDSELDFKKGCQARKNKDYKRAMEFYAKAADKGNAKAQNSLGAMYQCGEGTKQDYKKAAKWYSKAATQGNSDASYNLGNLYRTGLGVEKNLRKAFKLYLYAADHNDSFAQYNLSLMYANGEGVSKNYLKSLYYLKLAAKGGMAEAQYMLAERYEDGKGVAPNIRKAFEWYLKAAQQGDINAMISVGYCYVHGQGVENDNRQGFLWYEKAAQKGAPRAQHSLGYCYNKGIGAKKDITKARIWYKRAAEQGYADSLVNLGLLSWEEKDYIAAMGFLKKAIKLGSDDASILIARLYQYGKGVPVDLKKAEKLYRESANKGFAYGQNTLAYFYATENRNLEEAEKLAIKAIKQEPSNTYYNDTLGWVYYKQKKYDKAVAQLEKAISLFPKGKAEVPAVERDHLGDAYLALGKTKEAKAQWQKAIELTKDEKLKKEIEAKLTNPQKDDKKSESRKDCGQVRNPLKTD